MPFSFTSVKTLGVSAGALVAVFSAVTGFVPAVEAWDKQNLPTLSTRGFVREETTSIKMTQGETTRQIKSLQLDLAQGKKDQNMAARNKLEIDAITESSDQKKTLLNQEIRRIDETIGALNDQIKALKGGMGPN